VLDWELSTLGHPLADFSYHLMMYRMPHGLSSGLAGLDLPSLNIPSEAEYVAAYCRRTGRDGVPNWNFYLAFSMFRLASILQGVYARGLQGNAASAFALQRGAAARVIADRAWELANA
jgi:aminoglycoside phosphotransferase (APT) family kinase protein